MSDPADNPYQSPRGADASNAQAGQGKQPWWLEGLMVILGAGLEVFGCAVLLGVTVFLASVGVRSVGLGWTVLGFAALGISPMVLELIRAMLVGVIRNARRRSKGEDR
jgi:hypothetical protein